MEKHSMKIRILFVLTAILKKWGMVAENKYHIRESKIQIGMKRINSESQC